MNSYTNCQPKQFENPACLLLGRTAIKVQVRWACKEPVSRATDLGSSSSRSSDGNSSLLNEGGSASQVPQAAVEFAGYGSVVWPDSLSEWLIGGAGLLQMFCCLTASSIHAFAVDHLKDLHSSGYPARRLAL